MVVKLSGALWQMGDATVTASGVGERDHCRRMQIAIGREKLRLDLELGDEESLLQRLHPKPDQIRQPSAAALVHQVDSDAGDAKTPSAPMIVLAATSGTPAVEQDSKALFHPACDRAQRVRQLRRIGAAGLRHVRPPTALAADLLRNMIDQLAGFDLAGKITW
jgi:hypothetical protein